MKSPRAANDDLIERTCRLWQLRMGRDLCREDARQIAENVIGFFAILAKMVASGEGIETCLAAMQATGQAAWAALSTSGLRGLDLPRELRDVIALADGDDPGEAAAHDCARRWKREGRRVRIARPPQGMDFNDLLLTRTPRIGKGGR